MVRKQLTNKKQLKDSGKIFFLFSDSIQET